MSAATRNPTMVDTPIQKADLYRRLAAEQLGRMGADILELQTQIVLRDQSIQQLKGLLQTAQAEIAGLKEPNTGTALVAEANGHQSQ